MCIRDSRNIGHEVRVNGVTAVRAARVVEIYDVESRDFLVTFLVIQQVVVSLSLIHIYTFICRWVLFKRVE